MGSRLPRGQFSFGCPEFLVPDCNAPYCYVHWHVPESNYGHSPGLPEHPGATPDQAESCLCGEQHMPFGQNRQASFQQAKADHDFNEQELELKTNTELTREIHRLTTELHRRLIDHRTQQEK